MPELPEVETITRNLKPIFEGRKFLDMKIFNKNSFVKGTLKISDLKGKKLQEIKRRGKFINMFFEDDLVMTIHLRMTGRLIVDSQLEKYERVRLYFEKKVLSFRDLRKFGKVWLNKVSDYEERTGISRLGDEPLASGFDLKSFEKILNRKKGNIKAVLLNQHLIAGIGNIYADESLFYAGIRPQRRTESLEKNERKKLFEGIKCSLLQGIENSGTSFSDFVNAHGKKGSNQNLLFVYNRGGKKCLRCGTILQKIKVAGRGTVFCKKCQK